MQHSFEHILDHLRTLRTSVAVDERLDVQARKNILGELFHIGRLNG